MDKSLEVEVNSTDTLRKLYELSDELGILRRYSEEFAEVEVCIHDKWILFYLDRRALDEERADQEAFDDAQRLAEVYWRQ